MKRAYRLNDLLSAEGLNLSLNAKNSDGSAVAIISHSDAKRYIRRKYSDFLVSDVYESDLSPSENIELAGENFRDDFIMWRSVNEHNIQRMYEAVSAEYSPVENYNMIETHTGTETALQTPNDWKQTQTQTPNEWKSTETQTPTDWKSTETQTPEDWTSTQTQTPTDWKTTAESLEADNKSTTESYEYAYDSATASPSNKTETKAKTKNTTEQCGTFETATTQSGELTVEKEQTGTFKTETEQSGTMSTETAHTGTFEDRTTYNTTLTRNGNIGVSESAQLAQHEIEFRMLNIAFMLLDKFIKEYTFYVSGVDVVESEG